MYKYEDQDSANKDLNKVINTYLGEEYVYRVISNPPGYQGSLILIFRSSELLDKFINKHLSKYTCDTSCVYRFNLSIMINDPNISLSIINKMINEHKRVNKLPDDG